MRVERATRCLSGYAAPPHPGPLPQGERELHCACRAPAAFAPSPLTGEGWDEGGAGNSVIKRLRRPLTLALSHKGRGNDNSSMRINLENNCGRFFTVGF